MKKILLSCVLLCVVNAFSQEVSSQEKITLTIHANIDPKTTAPSRLRQLKHGAQILGSRDVYQILAEAESVSAGHSWISLKQGNSCKTFGLFDGGPVIDREKKYSAAIFRTVEISPTQRLYLDQSLASRSDFQWTGYYNCASYAAEIWKEVTGELINPVPIKTFYVDSFNKKIEVRENVRLKPLPPSPLGVIQEIIRLSGGRTPDSSSATVCP